MSKMSIQNLKIGYVPLKDDLDSAPGDYRRFAHYAKVRGINYEIARFDKTYDVVIVTQGADITLWRDYRHGIIIYDFIDSYLSIPKTNIKALLRGFAKYVAGQHKKLEFSYWNSIRKMCIRADVVICSTREQKDNILSYSSNVPIILDYHSNVVRNPKQDYKLEGGVVKLIWEGMPSNLYQLKLIKNTLLRLSKKYNIELNVATNISYYRFLGRYGLSSAKTEVENFFNNSVIHEWDKETISDIVRNCDIAIIPIDSKYLLTRSKPENKILFFWKMGIPVITSDIPSYSRTMKNVSFNLLCKDETDWYDKLESLILDQKLRKNVAIEGKKYADSNFSTEAITKEWDKVFESVGIEPN